MTRLATSPPKFQSAPLTEARGDGYGLHFKGGHDLRFNPLPSPKQGETDGVVVVALTLYRFQSAPLTEARGDFLGGGHLAVVLEVSIRSPHRSKGRPLVKMQSLPPRVSFNPLPSPKQGETGKFRQRRRTGQVSIRSPHRSKGRTILSARVRVFIICFNPLPSPKQGETLRDHPCPATMQLFQSAPLTEARGDE